MFYIHVTVTSLWTHPGITVTEIKPVKILRATRSRLSLWPERNIGSVGRGERDHAKALFDILTAPKALVIVHRLIAHFEDLCEINKLPLTKHKR